jgi:hypothetical protein
MTDSKIDSAAAAVVAPVCRMPTSKVRSTFNYIIGIDESGPKRKWAICISSNAHNNAAGGSMLSQHMYACPAVKHQEMQRHQQQQAVRLMGTKHHAIRQAYMHLCSTANAHVLLPGI